MGSETRNRGGAFLASFLMGVGLFAMFVFLSYYMQTVLHYSALKAGVAFLPFAGGLILAASASTAIVPRIGARIPMASGILTGAAGLGWLSQIGVHSSFWVSVLGPQLLMSIGLGLAFPALSNTALTNVRAADSGVASAMVNTTQQVGGSLGTALLNTVAATATAAYIRTNGPASVAAGQVHGYSVAFAVGSGLLVLAALAGPGQGPTDRHAGRSRGSRPRRGVSRAGPLTGHTRPTISRPTRRMRSTRRSRAFFGQGSRPATPIESQKSQIRLSCGGVAGKSSSRVSTRRYTQSVGGWSGTHRPPVDSMDEGQDLEGGSVGAELMVSALATNADPSLEADRPRLDAAARDDAAELASGPGIRTPALDAGPSPERSKQDRRSARATLWRINSFSAALAVLTGVLLFAGPLHDAGPIHPLLPQWAMFVLLCAMWAAAAWCPVELHYRGNTYLAELEEVPMLLGLVFLSPSLLILCVVCAETFVRAGPRRQPAVKLFFNVTSGAVSVVLAVLVYRELLGSHSPVSFSGWVAAAAALVTSTIATAIAVRIVIKLNGQTTERRTAVQFTTTAMLVAANICLSFVVLDLAWFSLWATIPLVLVAVLIVGAYSGYTRLTLRFSSLQRLYDFSRAIGTASLEPPSMSEDVLRQVCTVMRARRAELVLVDAGGTARRISIDEGEPSGFEPITVDKRSIVGNAVSTGAASLHNIDEQSSKPEHDPISGTYRHAVVAPIMNGRSAIGAIAAFDRDEELDDFDDDDLRLFETLVAHASASLERARLVEELRFEVDSKSHQATHDALTGLPNRVLFQARAAHALKESKGVAVVLLDIDRFKDVNDTLGHAIGDRLLCEVSERLVHAVSGRATVARLGGDEFALVIADVTEAGLAVAIVNDLHREMSRPIRIDGLALAVTASAGIALSPEHGDDVALLLQRADIAMYHAKEHRSKVELYSVEQDQSMHRWLMIGGLLTHALETGSELSVAYQPIADVKSGSFVRVEALARWNHPVHGFIPPDEFIGMAEQMGVINQISDFVLSQACAQAAEWRRNGLNLGLAVNLSGREFADPALVERIAGHLKENGLPPNALTLEVTETEVMADLSQVSVVLDELAARGISLAIDDYGTGYSSLAYIHRLPVQELKIDRSFVTSLPSESSNAIIVNSSIAMAHSLGLKVVAEGAEDEATCSMLAEADCDFVQGYYLSKPITSEQLESKLLEGVTLKGPSRRPRAGGQRPAALSVAAS